MVRVLAVIAEETQEALCSASKSGMVVDCA
jgi:hypothetical protein